MTSDWSSRTDYTERTKSDLEDDAIQPERWLFSEEGLTLVFSAYDGGCYKCTPPPITLRWAELKPLLVSGALERLHCEWKRSRRWFTSNSIGLIRFAIPVRPKLL